MEENKEWTKKYNPFNSDKLLSQVYKWKQIKRGSEIPPPTTISVDPINCCDLNCNFCNADFILKKNHNKLEKEVLDEISEFLPKWGVETICIGGGGESLLNNSVGNFISNCVKNNLGVGVVTNGTNIHNHLEGLVDCTWVGVSIDAGTRKTYFKLKGRDKFFDVLSNIESLVNKSRNNELGKLGQGYGVSYKYLLHPNNVGEVYEATKIAKDIGCRNMHIRPVSAPWDKQKNSPHEFKPKHIKIFKNQLEKAKKLEDDSFGVFGVTHKFGKDFKVVHNFKNCYAIFMNGVIMPPTDKTKGKFDFGLCCDRRGDSNLTLRNLNSMEQIKDFWGGEKHWEMFDKIKVEQCPRCTFEPHNRIYEKVIQINNMTYNFI